MGLPAGVLTGALVGVGGGGIAFGIAPVEVPSGVNLALQIMVGVMVGLRITRSALRSGLHALFPAGLLSVAMICTSVVAAVFAVGLTSMSLVTALFAAAPGGLTEMAVVSAAFGADGAAVAAVHLARLLAAIVGMNVALAYLTRKRGVTAPGAAVADPPLGASAGELRGLARITACGVVGGVAGILLGVPAGGVIGALAGAAAYRLLSERSVPVHQYGLGVQLLGGIVIGLGLSAEFFEQLLNLAGAGFILISAQLLLWVAASWGLARLFGYDSLTALFAAAPGGMSEVISTAGQSGADTVVVAFTHLVRLSAIIIFVPVLISLFVQ